MQASSSPDALHRAAVLVVDQSFQVERDFQATPTRFPKWLWKGRECSEVLPHWVSRPGKVVVVVAVRIFVQAQPSPLLGQHRAALEVVEHGAVARARSLIRLVALGPEELDHLEHLLQELEERVRPILPPGDFGEEEVPGGLVLHQEPRQRLVPQGGEQVPHGRGTHGPRQRLLGTRPPRRPEPLDGAYHVVDHEGELLVSLDVEFLQRLVALLVLRVSAETVHPVVSLCVQRARLMHKHLLIAHVGTVTGLLRFGLLHGQVWSAPIGRHLRVRLLAAIEVAEWLGHLLLVGRHVQNRLVELALHMFDAPLVTSHRSWCDRKRLLSIAQLRELCPVGPGSCSHVHLDYF